MTALLRRSRRAVSFSCKKEKVLGKKILSSSPSTGIVARVERPVQRLISERNGEPLAEERSHNANRLIYVARYAVHCSEERKIN